MDNKTAQILGKPIEEEFPKVLDRVIESKELLNDIYESTSNYTIKELLRGNMCEVGYTLTNEQLKLCDVNDLKHTSNGLLGVINFIQMEVESIRDFWDYSNQDIAT